MGLYLFFIFLIITIMTGAVLYVTAKNRKEDSYTDLETEEWDCPDCGFHVQAGDKCIYCDTEKPA